MRMRGILCIVALCIFEYIQAYGGGENRPSGGRSAALSNASITNIDLWSAFNNQAGLATLKRPEFGIYYENRYMLKEMSYKAAAFVYPVKQGAFAISLNYFGFSAYNESKVGLAYARSFGKYLSFGVQMDYAMINMAENYGNPRYVTFEAGMLAHITRQLSLGVHVYNPFNSKLSQLINETIPSIFRMGTSYLVTDKFTISFEAEKDVNHKAFIKSGFEYKVIPTIYLRAGIATNPSTFSFGIGIFMDKMIIDISSSYHQILGYSPQASVSYRF